jgi:hypothetical protein
MAGFGWAASIIIASFKSPFALLNAKSIDLSSIVGKISLIYFFLSHPFYFLNFPFFFFVIFGLELYMMSGSSNFSYELDIFIWIKYFSSF